MAFGVNGLGQLGSSPLAAPNQKSSGGFSQNGRKYPAWRSKAAMKGGEAMARLTQLHDVLFPVDEHPIFVGIQSPSGEKRISVPDKKAIVPA
jgi:hypothetical protein